MRTLEVSIDVYAAIWQRRAPGENNEDEILRRVLNVVPVDVDDELPGLQKTVGFKDARFNIELPEGFEIFRVYKGLEYRAKASQGQWRLLSTGKSYPTLNQLSRAVSGNVENAWRNWYFMGRDSQRHLIEGVRSDAKPSYRHLI
jgi:hypothetical protein